MAVIFIKPSEEFFWKMKEDKVKREKMLKQRLTWDSYFEIIWGIAVKVRK